VLAEAGIESPAVDVDLLAAHALGVPRSRLALAPGFDPPAFERFAGLVRERAARRPVQHLVGTAAFWKGELAVGPGVFIPRFETELLVEWGVARLVGISAPVVVDLCSGTGAIALAVATERPDTTVYAVEYQPAALEWLRRNTSGSPVIVVEGDATDPRTLSTVDGQVDLVLCNPPYVPEGTRVQPEVAEHDPYPAVFAGPDGLAVIRGIVPRATALLRPAGWVGIEHDDSHGSAVPALLAATDRFGEVDEHRDLAGRPRFATARRLADCIP
jgi:release factor glutamine methyltransferase